MRLFYAVTFSEDVRRELSRIQEELRAKTVRGNFTLFENLHLTLVFSARWRRRGRRRV